MKPEKICQCMHDNQSLEEYAVLVATESGSWVECERCDGLIKENLLPPDCSIRVSIVVND